MVTLRFKTNLKCKGCIQTIKPEMDSIPEIESWNVLLDIQDKVLEVDVKNKLDTDLIEKFKTVVTNAGYEIEQL